MKASLLETFKINFAYQVLANENDHTSAGSNPGDNGSLLRTTNNGRQNQYITHLINTYSKCVIDKDSITFYDLFNEGPVTWCAALKDKSQDKEFQKSGSKSELKSYFSGSYQAFIRSLFRYSSTEDKFDNMQIIEDGTVALVSVDYSFWADNKMTNWGCKYLSFIKREGKWKIKSVIYSIERADLFDQPSLEQRRNK